MAKRTRRRNKRYSHKRNSNKRRVSKKKRVSRRVSKKTYKRKNMRGGSGDDKILGILKSNPKFKTYVTNYEEALPETKTLIKQYLDSDHVDKKAKRQILVENLGVKSGHAIQFVELYSPPPGGGTSVAPVAAWEPAPAGGHSNDGMNDAEALAAAIRESLAAPGTGSAPARALARVEPKVEPKVEPNSGSKIIYDILEQISLLQYYSVLVDAEYNDSMIEDPDFLDDLNASLKIIIPLMGGHRDKIIQAFRKYIKARSARGGVGVAAAASLPAAWAPAASDDFGAAPAAWAERGGLTAQQQQQLAAQWAAQNAARVAAAAAAAGFGVPAAAALPAAAPAPAPASDGFGAAKAVGVAPSNMCVWCGEYPKQIGHPYCGRTCADAAAGGFGAPAAAALPAAVDIYIGYPGKNMCINCLKQPKKKPHQFCGKWCAEKLKEKKERYPIAGGTKCGDFSDNPANYPRQDSSILNGNPPVPQGQPDYDKERYIYFYENDKKYKEFSNFYPCASLVINGVKFPTSEHYFQCAKFKDPKFTECTRTFGEGARAVFNFARDNKSYVIDGWHRESSFPGIFYPWWPDYKPNLKDLEMYKAVYNKFTQGGYFEHLLLCTGDKIIVEHAYPDPYWGDRNFQLGKEQWKLGHPENHLGQILMLVRMDINNNNQHLPDVIARKAILTM